MPTLERATISKWYAAKPHINTAQSPHFSHSPATSKTLVHTHNMQTFPITPTPVAQLPFPSDIAEESLQNGTAWFLTCSPEDFEFYAINHAQFLATTLVYRSCFLRELLGRQSKARIMDLLEHHNRTDLVGIVANSSLQSIYYC